MSDIRFRCPECKGKLIIDRSEALNEVPCPLCGRTITAWGADLLDLRFKCPECQAKLVVDIKVAGSEATCPRCKCEILVPDHPMADFPPPPVTAPEREEDAAFPSPAESTGGGKLSKEEMDFLTSSPPQAAPARTPAPH